ncbi:MAG TPA: thiosulfate oxidation carrier protein SoxY [Burkholderiales bacterium]|nr:thiosulfate oxidation carrier protein SoxY [Burkholderiales bacterium]
MTRSRAAVARRRFLQCCAALVAWPRFAAAEEADALPALVEKLTGAKAPRDGKVTLDIPRIADNGNAVPLKVKIESAMTAQDHVRTIHLIAEKNPRPLVAAFFLGPHSGRAEIDTRIRLNGTQRVVAVATMADGSQWRGIAEVDVTESACYDATNP